jgi:predicted Zn-ribbon and HTH transcriptional regulator
VIPARCRSCGFTFDEEKLSNLESVPRAVARGCTNRIVSSSRTLEREPLYAASGEVKDK